MKKVCFSETMRRIDAAASEKFNIPGIVLMENAALSCVNALQRHFGCLKSHAIAVVCGKGNNGGDGLAIARHLYNSGADVRIYLVCGDSFSGDAAANYNIAKAMGIYIETIETRNKIPDFFFSCDAIVDAIFGTGIKGAVYGLAADVIAAVNKSSAYALSVDIPSGVNADTGEVCGVCVQADRTVTFAAYKAGMFLFPGADFVGKTEICGISVPEAVTDEINDGIFLTDSQFVRESVPKRRNNTHKGDYGKVFVLGGSEGLTGAAYLSSQAALYSGSGLVTLGIPRSLNPIMEEKLTEVMTLPLDDIDGGLSINAADSIIEAVNSCGAALIGPGLGRSRHIEMLLERILEHAKVPLIIDADGINALSRNMDMLSQCSCDILLTPHIAEFSRLSGLDTAYIDKNRIDVSRSFAEEYGVNLILKGYHTIVTAYDTRQYINNTGNPGMASGGSGDVLAGMAVSFAARGMPLDRAAAVSAYLHGGAGDICAERTGENSVTASGIIECIPEAFRRCLE